jgi:hypothetical protein
VVSPVSHFTGFGVFSSLLAVIIVADENLEQKETKISEGFYIKIPVLVAFAAFCKNLLEPGPVTR